MVKVTNSALKKVLALKKEEKHPDNSFIRVSVQSGGCSGLVYKMDFDTQLHDNDDVFKYEGVNIVVDKKSLLYLIGTTLEYSEGLNGKGFQFTNPNATRTCGCGESFSI